MRKFWFRRKSSRGEWWSIYIVPSAECQLRDGTQCDALSDLDEHVILLAAERRDDFCELLKHEWLHVECWAHGIPNHETDTPLHRAIDAGAFFRMPAHAPPEIG